MLFRACGLFCCVLNRRLFSCCIPLLYPDKRHYPAQALSLWSVLLQELDRYTGIVIFATNLAANVDPAFERRIRTHVLFELPGETERVQI